MKKILLTIFLCRMLYPLQAQVIINPQLPPLGLVLKSQLWNISVINTGNESVQVQVQLLMSNVSNNQKVFSGTSRFITLQKGLNMITANDAAPITYNMLSPGYGVDGGPDGFLPVGAYNVCYSVNAQAESSMETLTQECETVEIEPASPPALISPVDSESVDITRPLFTWIPPSPYSLFTNPSYNFKLVELYPSQNSSDAIRQNIPLQVQSNISTTCYQYPVSLPELDTAKLYAWQITANNSSASVSQSEIWVFRIKGDGTVTIPGKTKSYYTKATRVQETGFTVCDGVLQYAYMNESNDPYMNFNLYDITGAGRRQIQLDSSYTLVKYGQNYNQLDFTQGNILSNKHMYLLELINLNNEKWYVKFEFIKP